MTFERNRNKKSAFIKRVDVYSDGDVEVGEAWAAVDAEDQLISISTDIAVVTSAAFKSGHWIEDQVDA